jgi:hypothetical protein
MIIVDNRSKYHPRRRLLLSSATFVTKSARRYSVCCAPLACNTINPTRTLPHRQHCLVPHSPLPPRARTEVGSMPGTPPIFEASGRHYWHSPDEEIGPARTCTIRRRLRARFLGALCLRRLPGAGDSFSLRAGCTRRGVGSLRLCLCRLRQRTFAHIDSRVGTGQLSKERPDAARRG